MFEFNCLLLRGAVPLTEEIRWELYKTAFEMHKRGRGEEKIKDETFEGKIVATGKTALIGGIFGHVFDANLECESGTGNVRFIVNAKDFLRQENGVWVPAYVPENIIQEIMAL